MEITEVRVKLMEDSDDRLQAFCSITFDSCFVVRDLKIIEGAHGPFVAMPSRKLTAHCSHCGAKNHLRAGYCNHCGTKQREDRTVRDADGRAKLYADIAHPINSNCREMIQSRVIAEFQAELERSKQPGYASRYDEDYGFDAGEDYSPSAEESGAAAISTVAKETRLDGPHHESQPRGPHRIEAPALETESRPETGDDRPGPHAKPASNRGEFGAGIFD
jgi:stage V sporulation protein G